MAEIRSKRNLTREEVQRVLNYCPETGIFTWKVFASGRYKTDGHIKPGDIAGDIGNRGYRRICVGYKRITAHRLAWLMMTGLMPPKGMQIDHIDGRRDNNRWANLRLASNGQNQMNAKMRADNSSGARGVSFCKITGRWYAYINVAGKRYDLGRHECRDAAIAARAQAEIERYGEFRRTQG